jgi:putative drug exporter of the RND superfamily
MRQPPSSVLPKSDPPRRHRAHAPYTERIAAWSARHKKLAVLTWLVMVVAAFAVGQMLHTPNIQSYDTGQSGQAERTLNDLKVTSPPAEHILIQSRHGTVTTDPAVRAAAAQVTARLRALPRTAAHVLPPVTSADHRSELISFTVPGNGSDEDSRFAPALRAVAAVQAAHPSLLVTEAGDASEDRVANQQIGHDFHQAELTSIPVTLVLLLLTFGALIAAGIPLLLAGTAVVTAISLLAVPGQWLPVGSSTSEVMLLIGMAVGVDYSLFYLRREREERAAGASTAQALRTAARTSGRAIVVSGLTVMIALAGLFLTGYSVFTGVAIGAIMVVGVTVVGSVTVLPALLSWLGQWADRGRIPFLGRRRTAARESRLWAGLARRVVRRPVVWGSVALIGMLALAAPAAGLRLANPADGGFSASLPVVHSINEIQRAFPGSPAPAQVVVTATSPAQLTGPAMATALTRLRADVAAGGVSAEPVAHGRALLVNVPLAGNGTDARSDRALLDLRDKILPDTIGRVSGVTFAVTGETAQNHDDVATLHSRTALAIAVVALLAFGLLLFAFRSLPIALVSVALNLVSVGAAFGLITLIFQDGHLQGPLDFTSYGGIVPWIPLFIFVFLFGLSMDYHVFLISRISELRKRGATTPEAVIGGISGSAGVITSAAAIMVAVFSVFATLSVIQLKSLGVGLAAAVLIDATVVRGILLPATLALFGERAWYLPRALRWIPGGRARSGPAGPAGPAAPPVPPAPSVPAGSRLPG